jgi:DNA-binding beta-propeller fold protein YncE
MAVRRWSRPAAILASLFLILMAAGPASAQVKVRVSVDSAGIKATPDIGSRTLANLPLGTVLNVDAKQGDWYKVTTSIDGTAITGYIHQILVEEVVEGESASAASLGRPVMSQDETIAAIGLKLKESEALIQEGRDLDKAAENLRPLLAKTFGVDDRGRQKQIATEIYLWLGLSYSKGGDSLGALREFLNMFEVDYFGAKEITRNISEPAVSSLIERADKQSRGLLVDFLLEITSEPKGAAVRIDGKETGFTPELYRSPVPKLRLEIAKEGYKTHTEDIVLVQPSTRKEVVLESTGRPVLVSSAPAGARVFVDGQDSGKTTDSELSYVSYGPHVIKLKKTGWADHEQSIEIPAGTGPIEVKALLTAVDYAAGMKMGGPGTNVFKLPKAVAFDGAGNFYVADESEFDVKKYSPEGRRQVTWGLNGREFRSLKKPAGIAVDGRGYCYVTDAELSAVFKFTKDGVFVAKWGKPGTKPGEFTSPLGIAVDHTGDIYVADSGNNRVVVCSPEGAVKNTWEKTGTGADAFVSPAGVAVTPQNEIVVIDRSRIQKFSTQGEPIVGWGKAGTGDGEFNRPLGLAVDAHGYVYAADTGNNRVQKFDARGALIAKWGSGGQGELQISGPAAIAVNDKGSVFVIETLSGRLVEFKVPPP